MSDFNSDRFKKIEKDIREHEEIKGIVQGLRIQMESGFEVININIKSLDKKTDDILSQVLKTNGRVTVIEQDVNNELSTWKFLKKRKWIILFMLFGFLYIYDQLQGLNLIDKILNLIK